MAEMNSKPEWFAGTIEKIRRLASPEHASSLFLETAISLVWELAIHGAQPTEIVPKPVDGSPKAITMVAPQNTVTVFDWGKNPDFDA